MGRTGSLEKTLMLGKIEDRRRRGDRGWDGWMASLTQWTWIWVNSKSWWWTGRAGVLQSMRLQKAGHAWGTELNWTCLLRILYAGQEATVKIRHETTDCFQIGKGVHQGCILSPCLFNLYAEDIMRNVGLDEAIKQSRLLGEISITSDMQMIPTLWQKLKN